MRHVEGVTMDWPKKGEEEEHNGLKWNTVVASECVTRSGRGSVGS